MRSSISSKCVKSCEKGSRPGRGGLLIGRACQDSPKTWQDESMKQQFVSDFCLPFLRQFIECHESETREAIDNSSWRSTVSRIEQYLSGGEKDHRFVFSARAVIKPRTLLYCALLNEQIVSCLVMQMPRYHHEDVCHLPKTYFENRSSHAIGICWKIFYFHFKCQVSVSFW